MTKQPRVEKVNACPPARLEIAWSTGETFTADIADWISRFAVLAPLRNAELFSKAQVGYGGHSVAWPGDIDLGADQLYERCKIMAGDFIPVKEFLDWMERNRLSLTAAAKALGLSRRMVAYYRSGARPIPKIVGLACKGWEAQKQDAA